MRILLVEDDAMLGATLKSALEPQGYTVDWLRDGAQALQAISDQHIDLVILDLGLPKMDGMTVLNAVRRKGVSTPILILTARDTVQDKVKGLDAGADDYLLKPFDLAELNARLRALTRRANGRANSQITHGAICLDPDSQSVHYQNTLVVLHRREFMLLHELLENTGKVLTRQQLEQSLYGWGDDIESNALEVHIHHLRKKFYPELIKTIRGVGYIVEKAKS
ncbi:response regulator [Agitococcus lubricus]|uniref:Two-component system response regulator QseB n=1 Tax=Agitococcus lubricus TaxID=1077255 RepID=A0A2T5J1X8_9GAMM|nr:response regulator [Agitococcus lubricus]PTQ90445.1 two-component system response regulator QseB [Agitococcus lubricus]